MTTWEERIDRSTHPAIVVEHVARYRFARPLAGDFGLWADLGCGTGIALKQALEADPLGGRLLLVDSAPDAVSAAAAELPDAQTLVLDLTSTDDLGTLRSALLEGGAEEGGCVTCFEVIEHLADFTHLIDLLVDVTSLRPLSVALSVPKDAFTGVDNPHHVTSWGSEAVDELRRVLPAGNILVAQRPLQGTFLGPVEQRFEGSTSLTVASEGSPSHYVVVFGSRPDAVESVGIVERADLDGQRVWERQREADLAYFRQREQDLLGHEPA
jgi:hypothetical protein